MNARTLSAVVLVALMLSGRLVAQQPALGVERMRALALRISQLERNRQLPSGTMATIDSLLAMYSDSVVYEHPNAGAVIRGKTALRSGMKDYLGSVPQAHFAGASV